MATNKREIEIVVEGGIIQNIIGIPDDVVVVVRDYDCDESDKATELDAEDKPCVISFWTAEKPKGI